VMDDRQRVALIETRTVSDGADAAPRQLVRFQHVNHLGSTTLELDEAARVISYEEYHPYGSTAYQAARNATETPKRYRYTGKERDEESGFSYHGARYYAPWLGRWVSCDPVGLGDGPNLYAYARGRPTMLRDPDGRTGTSEGPGTPTIVWQDPKGNANTFTLGPVITDQGGLDAARGNRVPGTEGATLFLGDVKADPLTTLADDAAFKDVAERVWARMTTLDYDNYRKNLNSEIRDILSGSAPNRLKQLLEVKNGRLVWKSGEFADQGLNYAHIVSQKTIENLGLDKGLAIHPANLAPTGETFHLSDYGHREEIATKHGLAMSEEAKAGLRALRVERPPNAPQLDIAFDAPKRVYRPSRPGQSGFIDAHLLLDTAESRAILRKVAGGIGRHGPDVAMLAIEGKDENSAFATWLGILVGTLAFRALATPPGAAIAAGAVVTGAAWYTFFSWRVAVEGALNTQHRGMDPRLDR
jgi:RHS repeat-associated protein